MYLASIADSNQNIDLSSFDINAICYDIDTAKYIDKSYYELVYTIYLQLDSICKNKIHSDRIVSVDGREYIFRNNENKLTNLKKLMTELTTVFVDLYNR